MHYIIFSGPPKPQLNINRKAIVGNETLQVDFDNLSAAFPKPFFLQVEKFGPPPDDVTIVNYFTLRLFFHKIVKENTGTYTIRAANYHLKNETEQISLGATNLTLNVQCKVCNLVNVHYNNILLSF